MIQNNEFRFLVKNGVELTEEEKERLMQTSIAEYPPFAEYYKKNKYYSVIKPQMVGLVLHGNEIVGKGKLLWQEVEVDADKIKLFGFGVLIDKTYQGRGLGTQLIKLYIEKARELGGDVLYGSTENPVVDKMLPELGFKRLTVPVEYTHAVTGERVHEKNRVYVYELKPGILEIIESLPMLYLGQGPI